MPNVYVLTDENGNEIGRREYDAFGRVISETGDWSQCRFGFNPNWIELKDSGGRFVISPTRIYDKDTGRYLTRDPVAGAAPVNASAPGNALGKWKNTAFEPVVAAEPVPGQGPPNPYLYLRGNPLLGAGAAGLQEDSASEGKEASAAGSHESLLRKVLAILRSRAKWIFTGALAPLINTLSGNTYELDDELLEIQKAAKGDIDNFYRKLIENSKECLTQDWQRIDVPEQNAVHAVGQDVFQAYSEHVTSAAWWLHKAAKVMVRGELEAMRREDATVYIRNLNIDWAWHDDIDARSIAQANPKTVKGWLAALTEWNWDIIMDKLVNADFHVVIRWKDERKQVIRIP